MSINLTMSQIKNLESEISNLNKKIASEKDKEAKGLDKMAKARKKMLNTKNISTFKSAQREYQSATAAVQKAKDEEAKLSKKVAEKAKRLSGKQNDLSKAQAKEREKHQKEFKKLQEKAISIQATQVQQQLNSINKSDLEEKEYDVFISHASEDKESFVEPLTKALKSAGINTWYDAEQIGWGKSIRQSIDNGLIKSKFCIIILSQNFLDKYWTNYELNGIFQKDSYTQDSIILPIWHNVTRDEIQKRNLTLTDILALNTSIHSTEDIVNAMLNLLKLSESELEEDFV
ncbi:toll/interleukin-1 receptor domain-containing protein [Priestia endophytica]|uniref:toll/interleukin-1 receptor domain-containing protein n=1 Tax=Priestia endophytica TaxID=135735 RepID=UPI0015583EF2|nr:toll/interleukin-1 receptor domain-containing protein [Priestia endophytica]